MLAQYGTLNQPRKSLSSGTMEQLLIIGAQAHLIYAFLIALQLESSTKELCVTYAVNNQFSEFVGNVPSA